MMTGFQYRRENKIMANARIDKEENLKRNRELFGDKQQWVFSLNFGYHWHGGELQKPSTLSKLTDTLLRPLLMETFVDPYALKILEIACGAGRFTAELIRYAEHIDLLDMNQACIDICTERFQYYPLEKHFYVNDGYDCSMLNGNTYDLIASFASMVHVQKDILQNYLTQWSHLLKKGGIIFFDHSAFGESEKGFRSDVNMLDVRTWVQACRMDLLMQKEYPGNRCFTACKKSAGKAVGGG
jgi:SAM-dependent methyltransferase